MRRQALLLTFIVAVVILFNSFAYAYVYNAHTIAKKTIDLKKQISKSEAIFEALVGNFIGVAQVCK